MPRSARRMVAISRDVHAAGGHGHVLGRHGRALPPRCGACHQDLHSTRRQRAHTSRGADGRRNSFLRQSRGLRAVSNVHAHDRGACLPHEQPLDICSECTLCCAASRPSGTTDRHAHRSAATAERQALQSLSTAPTHLLVPQYARLRRITAYASRHAAHATPLGETLESLPFDAGASTVALAKAAARQGEEVRSESLGNT